MITFGNSELIEIMPNIKPNLFPPANWDDFEELCYSLWMSIWGDPSAHRNGRQGQDQDGVDIYGIAPFDNLYTGIQCKGKNTNYGSRLTKDELKKECKKAKSFIPSLGTFILATTSPRDAKIQELCRVLSHKMKYGFKVDTWFWDDIKEEILCRPLLMQRFYDNKVREIEQLKEIKLLSIDSSNRLIAFFSRPNLIKVDDFIVKKHIYDVTYELAMNAFYHGRASWFRISVEGTTISFIDNGRQFDPRSLLKRDSTHGGRIALFYAAKYFYYQYDFKNNENVFEMELNNKEISSSKNKQNTYTLELCETDIFRKDLISGLAHNEITKIPKKTKNIVIDISKDRQPAPSMTLEYLDTFFTEFQDFQKVTVYVPHDFYYLDELAKRVNSSKIIFVRKD